MPAGLAGSRGPWGVVSSEPVTDVEAGRSWRTGGEGAAGLVPQRPVPAVGGTAQQPQQTAAGGGVPGPGGTADLAGRGVPLAAPRADLRLRAPAGGTGAQ